MDDTNERYPSTPAALGPDEDPFRDGSAPPIWAIYKSGCPTACPYANRNCQRDEVRHGCPSNRTALRLRTREETGR